jgi:hypothetical protein
MPAGVLAEARYNLRGQSHAGRKRTFPIALLVVSSSTLVPAEERIDYPLRCTKYGRVSTGEALTTFAARASNEKHRVDPDGTRHASYDLRSTSFGNGLVMKVRVTAGQRKVTAAGTFTITSKFKGGGCESGKLSFRASGNA